MLTRPNVVPSKMNANKVYIMYRNHMKTSLLFMLILQSIVSLVRTVGNERHRVVEFLRGMRRNFYEKWLC